MSQDRRPPAVKPATTHAPATAYDRPAAPKAEAVLRRERLQAERAAARRAAPVSFVDPPPQLETDTLWRSLTRNGEARLLVVRATQTVTEAARRLQTSADVTRVLGELILGTLLLRSTLSPDERLQLYLNHHGPIGQVAVDAWKEGGVRAYVKHPQEELRAFGFLIGEGTLQVSRIQGGRSYSSTVPLDGHNVPDFLMNYLLESEQILSMLRTEVEVDHDGQVLYALGYLVQLMPEGTRDDLRTITAALEQAPSLADAMTPSDPDARSWAGQLLGALGWDQVAREAVAFQCRCSLDRMLSMLSSLPRKDLAELAASKSTLELQCDYCHQHYHVHPQALLPLLGQPS
jgi:molecular chaperone Hsp33